LRKERDREENSVEAFEKGREREGVRKIFLFVRRINM
jgi:hypothetical protein